MAHQVSDIIKLMEEIAPPWLAESWDNVGLQVGSRHEPVKKIMVTLDVTADVIREAADKNVDLIIAHHPILFKPIKALTDNTVTGSQVAALIRSGISVYVAHTNFDKAQGGTDDTLAELLGLKDIRPLTMDAEHPSFGRIGRLRSKLPLEAYLNKIKKALNAYRVDYIGNPEKEIEIAACCAGAGGDLIEAAQNAGADLFITGEAKYHELLSVMDGDMTMAVLGHFTTEYPAMAALKQRLQNWLNALQYNIEIIPSEDYGKCFRRLKE
ncbi:MAG TPA: Nif3-like dinuclear metal center hexameric protein [Clostridiales bacterium]|nr:Nif3-like dinuclear metal center hexameric protein [Clostridiales bacterium]